MFENNSEMFFNISEIDYETNVKLFNVFNFDYSTNDKNVIFITKEDKAFCFGHNSYGVLGFGHDIEMNEMTINEDISDKRIIDFKNSCYHTIARTSDGKLYSWGSNRRGLLGNAKEDSVTHKPKLIKFFSNKYVIDICCGSEHTLALTSKGEVYAWGRNDSGQTGSGINNGFVSIPFKVNFKGEKVKAISCGFSFSMALTASGHVFSWGWNRWGQMGTGNKEAYYSPKPIKLSAKIIIEKISCGLEHSLLLSRDGDVYVFGRNHFGQLGNIVRNKRKQLTPKKLVHSEKFIEISSHPFYNISSAVTKSGLFYVWGECGEEVITKPKVVEFKSFHEIFDNFFKITQKSILFHEVKVE